jgi:hypothetical protein
MIATDTCAKGHPYTEENLRIVTIRGKQTRQCRQCDKDRAQSKRDRLRGDRPKFKKQHLADECFRGHKLEGDNLYFYDTPSGKQRRCRACEEVRRLDRISTGATVQPTQTHCLRGHAMEGNNVSYRSDGFAVCKQCAVARTMKHKNANYEEVLERKKLNRGKHKDAACEAAKILILAVYAEAEDLDDDELIRRLKAALPPAEQ